MTSADRAVLIMARAPRPGAVKTRLQPLLGPDGCARLQAALIERTVRLAERVAPGRVFLALDGGDELPAGVRMLTQHGRDLGTRMRNAVTEVWADHRGPVVVIGTDAPTLQARQLLAAFAALDRWAQVVFGPAVDGGYYLTGLRRSAAAVFGIDPALWGGPEVLAASLIEATAARLSTGLLEPLRDLDTPADARALLAGGALPTELAELLDGPAAARR